ncbi:carbohydrate-binding protein [Mucilaginibacter sp.]|uniref:carbohydrate-binding protein n=1 Tax=Mucilaginibacter sp. TaxID=1882438 RepID=UPI00262FEB3A|nr:carbohydrate-binding protein [Mucilaginibacter sp.]MDB5029873.1 carbohydrate-binding protein [Mucilaginibacter sp.]
MNKSLCFSSMALLVFVFFAGNRSYGQPYMGKPFADSLHHGVQTIPGKLQCALYDLGGEGVAYHDSDGINQGSGKLNPADGTYLNEFRLKEGVDISYTKFREPAIDNNAYNLVMPLKDELYVGWTAPGEWVKYTVLVKEAGTYTLGMMYTANQGGKISISINDMDKTGLVNIPSTYVKDDPIQWRQWHHWNYLKDFAKVKLDKGIQIITLYTKETGQMNYGYINFTLARMN